MLNLPRAVAVDTNVALDVAAGVEEVCDAMATIRSRLAGAQLILPPTVLTELAHAAESADRALREAARRTLREHRAFGFRLVSFVPPGAAHVERVRASRLLPEREVHDSVILVEAAALGCALLTTSDKELRAVDYQRLALELSAFDLVAPVIATPREIVRKFFR